MYAKWDSTPYYYLAQVVSIKEGKVYHLQYMDGYVRDDVPQRQIRTVPARQKNDPYIGKTFYDPGDYNKKNPVKNFKKGEFVILCREPGKEPSYYCDRITNCGEKREIHSFGVNYVRKLVDKYEKE